MKEKSPTRCHIKAGSVVHTEDKLRVELTLRNPGERPAFAVNRVRRLELDAANHKLILWFSDQGRKTGGKKTVRKEFSVPRTSPIEAGSEAILIETLPNEMTRLVPHDDGTFELESLDLRKVNQVEIHVAVGDKPFYFNASQEDLVQQLAGWGADVSTTMDVSDQPYRQDMKEGE